jgi:FkbM family methyltransferase
MFAILEKFIRLAFYPKTILLLFIRPRFSITGFLLVEELKNAGIQPASIIDIGANSGQFAISSIYGFDNCTEVHSFEPQTNCIETLSSLSKKVPELKIYPFGLGNEESELAINVNLHSPASSFLELNDSHLDAFPSAIVERNETVQIKVLDNVIDIDKLPKPVLMKIDVQGFEEKVLLGASQTLKKVEFVLIEVSFKSMYKGEADFKTLINLLSSLGFDISSPMDFLRDPKTGNVLQSDFLFINRNI